MITRNTTIALTFLIFSFYARTQYLVPIWLPSSGVQILCHTADSLDSTIYLNLHENEQTSIKAVKNFSENYPLNFFYLNHDQTRRAHFIVEGDSCSFDPNRIYTKKGIRKTLKDGGKNNRQARQITKIVSDSVLEITSHYNTIVSLHNNTPDNYSIYSYMPDSSESQNTAKLYINPEMDPDDFIYTTDESIYEFLVEQQINVILQDNRKYVNDGSLSVYCGKNDISYLNIETEHGHLDMQLILLFIIHNHLNSKQ